MTDIVTDALTLEAAYIQRKKLETVKQPTTDSASVAKIQKLPKNIRQTTATKAEPNSNKHTSLDSSKQCLRCGAQRHAKDQKCPAANSKMPQLR